MERVENIGGHYVRTLRLWREAFLSNFEAKIRPALQRQYPDMSEAEVRPFQRKWEVCDASALFDIHGRTDTSASSTISPTVRPASPPKRRVMLSSPFVERGHGSCWRGFRSSIYPDLVLHRLMPPSDGHPGARSSSQDWAPIFGERT